MSKHKNKHHDDDDEVEKFRENASQHRPALEYIPLGIGIIFLILWAASYHRGAKKLVGEHARSRGRVLFLFVAVICGVASLIMYITKNK